MKYYNLTIDVLTKLYIGSGQKIKKYEYVYDGGDSVRIINHKKLLEMLAKENLFDDFLDFIIKIINNEKNADASLYNYLNNRKNSKGKLFSDKNILDSITEYKVSIKPQSRFNDIRLFVKDHSNLPFVPASSVKGMIVNAITATDSYEDIKKISSAIMISDSLPIKTENLIIDTVQRFNIKKCKSTAVNEYAEFLKPGTKIHMKLKIDSKVITINQIESALQSFSQNYQKYYRSRFSGFCVNVPANSYMFLGAYTGFASKTIIYPKYKEEAHIKTSEILSKQFKKNKNNFIYNNVSPVCLKCVGVNGILYDCGAVDLNFTPVEVNL